MARNLGFKCPPDHEFPNYSTVPHENIAEIGATKLLVPAVGLQAGQIGLFWFKDRGHGQHFAIFALHGRDNRMTMIHSYFNIGRVVETGISDFWHKRLIRVYDYREIANA